MQPLRMSVWSNVSMAGPRLVWTLAVNAFEPPVLTGRVKPRKSLEELRKLLASPPPQSKRK
jgi:hypothetical protein